MKAFNVKNGIQFSCDLTKESWRQGETISGVLEVSSQEVAGSLILALGSKKKIKERDAKAYSVIERIDFAAGTTPVEFNFSLASECSIAETYLLFGSGEDLFEYGNLLLPIKIGRDLARFLEVLNLFFKFKTKKVKSNKRGFVEALIDVPPSKEYANIVSLKILLKLEGERLITNYEFVINKVNFATGFTEVEKEKILIEKSLEASEYLIYGDSFNQDIVKDAIATIIDQVKKKQLKI